MWKGKVGGGMRNEVGDGEPLVRERSCLEVKLCARRREERKGGSYGGMWA